MKPYSFLLLIALLLLGTSCKNGTENNASTDTDENDMEFYYILMTDSMSKIDALAESPVCLDYSLDFSKNEKERYFAQLFCDSTGTVLQMVENNIDKDGLYTFNKFYYNKKSLFATYASYQKYDADSSLAFIEEYNFYDDKGKIKASYQKEMDSKTMEEGDFQPSTRNKVIDDSRILKAIKNEGEFALTFQGVIRTDEFNYLIVGEPKDDGYTSALQIVKITPFIQEIYNNEEAFIGRKIKVSFQRQTEGNMSFQILEAASWEK